MQFFGVETFNFDKTLVRRGCFPYTNDYPYSHSLVGMAAVGMYTPFDWRYSVLRYDLTA